MCNLFIYSRQNSRIHTNSLDSGYDDKIDALRNTPRKNLDSSKPGQLYVSVCQCMSVYYTINWACFALNCQTCLYHPFFAPLTSCLTVHYQVQHLKVEVHMMEIIKEEIKERRMIRDVEEDGGHMYVFKKYFLKYMLCEG